MANWWDRLGLYVGLSLCILVCCSAQGVVEGFEGGAVVLPCTVSIQVALRWRAVSNSLLIIRLTNGTALPPDNTPWKDVVSFVGSSNNLSISSLSHQRDDNRTFWCEGLQGGRGQNTTVRVLAKITEASIEQASGGQVTVTEGTSKTLICAVTGNADPAPSYTWRVDNGGVLGQGSSYTLRANRSMRNITCTATNTYSNGSMLSTADATATLNVLYLDTPSAVTQVSVTENEAATLPCSADGNPQPTFEWRRSGSAEVMSTSADYRIENVQRSAAGEYTCDVTNSVGSRQTRVKLVVQYPPAVTVTYDKSTHTLTCTAEGVPDTYTFSPWEQRLGGTFIRTLGTQTNTATAILQLDNTLTYADTGDYVCSVTNGVKSPQIGLVHVAPPTPAVFQKHSESVTIGLGKTQTISVFFYARPSSGNVQVRWEKAGETNALQSHQEEAGLVSLVVYGQQVSLQGTGTTLTLTDVSQGDEGNYSVTVTSDINGAPRVSQTSFHVNVTKISDGLVTAPGGGGGESNPGAIVGGVLGSLVCILVICAGVVIVLKRHKTNGSPEVVEDRHIASIGENNEGARHFPADADSMQDPNVSQAQNYETLNQFHVVGPSDRTYDQLHVPVIGTNNTYENTEVPGRSTRTTNGTGRDNYETLDQTHSPTEGSPDHTYDQLQISMRGKSGTYENTEVACRSSTKANDLNYENVNT